MTAVATGHVGAVPPILSLVVPVRDEAANIDAFVARATAALDRLDLAWEIVFVDDGSRDASLAAMLAAHARDPRIGVVALTRNFGKEVALTAGLDHARGEAVVPIDADLQHPPEVVAELVARWREGAPMVVAVRRNAPHDGALRRLLSRAFYAMFRRVTSIDLPQGAGDFRLLSAPVVAALRALPERTRFMKGLYAWAGFPYATVPYDVAARAEGRSSFGIARLWRLGSDAIMSFSAAPLKIASFAGFVMALVAIVYGAWLVGKTLVLGIDLPGYASTITLVLFLGGLQLLSLGILGEYVARIYDEVKSRPIYVVRARHGVPPPAP
ncbi:MAG TPA: glycosyltransferase family 2 protein [Casimicrobiaceae bacterium]|jgi:glycosyltransferase involved in cell wall biosynthesis|nr:glycosyltransferase family 2 protein [Casimicrobiaceae bacterium]